MSRPIDLDDDLVATNKFDIVRTNLLLPNLCPSKDRPRSACHNLRSAPLATCRSIRARFVSGMRRPRMRLSQCRAFTTGPSQYLYPQAERARGPWRCGEIRTACGRFWPLVQFTPAPYRQASNRRGETTLRKGSFAFVSAPPSFAKYIFPRIEEYQTVTRQIFLDSRLRSASVSQLCSSMIVNETGAVNLLSPTHRTFVQSAIGEGAVVEVQR
jgi:hypothetical protein